MTLKQIYQHWQQPDLMDNFIATSPKLVKAYNRGIFCTMGFGEILKFGGGEFFAKKIKRKTEKQTFYLVLSIHSLPSCIILYRITSFFVPAFVSYLKALSSLLFLNDTTETILHWKQQCLHLLVQHNNGTIEGMHLSGQAPSLPILSKFFLQTTSTTTVLLGSSFSRLDDNEKDIKSPTLASRTSPFHKRHFPPQCIHLVSKHYHSSNIPQHSPRVVSCWHPQRPNQTVQVVVVVHHYLFDCRQGIGHLNNITTNHAIQQHKQIHVLRPGPYQPGIPLLFLLLSFSWRTCMGLVCCGSVLSPNPYCANIPRWALAKFKAQVSRSILSMT
jgi:hypothetical protein